MIAPLPGADRPDHLHPVEVEGSVLVYDRIQERAHLLNGSAAAVWALCDGRPVDDIVAQLAERFGTTAPDGLDADVRRTVAELSGNGLLDRPVAGDEPPPVTPAAMPAGTPGPPHADRGPVFAALAHRFQVAGDAAEVPDVRLLFAALADPPDAAAGAGAVHHYALDDGLVADQRRLHVDGALALSGTVPRTLDHLFWHVNHQAVHAGAATGVVLHAAAAEVAGATIVLPGEMNAGKSTLVAGLVRAGASYLTDEGVAVHPGTGLVAPYPKPLALDRGSWPLFPELAPDAGGVAASTWSPADDPTGAARRLRACGTNRWWVVPAELGDAPPATGERRPTAVVVVRHDPDRPTTLAPLAPPEALLALTGNVFGLAAHPARYLDQLAVLAVAVPSHRLTVNRLDDAVAAVEDLARTLVDGGDPGRGDGPDV